MEISPPHQTLSVGSGPYSSPVLKDVNDDDILDIVTSNKGSGTVSIALGDGHGNFTPHQTLTVGGSPNASPTLVDINNDGVSDLLVTNFSTNDMSVFLGDGEYETLTSEDLDISTQPRAQNALALVDAALYRLSQRRASIGAFQNRLDSASNAALLTVENLDAAKSQILDADIAEETAELTRQQILQQAGVSVLSQANVSLQIVLDLLKF